MIIYYDCNELAEVFNLITLKFNSDLIFVHNVDDQNDIESYYIQYNNTKLNTDYSKCLNIVDCKDNNCFPNVLNLHSYYYILECDVSTIGVKYENLVYLSYVIYNFIVMNTKFQTNNPIVLDPISTMIYLQNDDKSFIRIGDGELSILENKLFSDWNYASKIQNKEIFKESIAYSLHNSNSHLLSGICDIFETEYFTNVFNEEMILFWKNFPERYLTFSKNRIYGSCFVGRIFMYKNINQNKYLESIGSFVKNKKNIIVCNKDIMHKYINSYYFQSDKNIFVLCENEQNYDDNMLYVSMNKIINNIIRYYNVNIHRIFLHYGVFSKYVSVYLLNNNNIKTVDLGYFAFNTWLFPKNYYYDINNVLSSLNYYIFHNNIVPYDIITTSTDILDESDTIVINIKKIISLNDKLEPNMQSFGIRFNQTSIADNYLNSVIKGKLSVKSNIPLKLFNGKNWLHINTDSYENDFEIYNINKWRISPSNEYLNEHIGQINIEFIIYHIGFKIYEIV